MKHLLSVLILFFLLGWPTGAALAGESTWRAGDEQEVRYLCHNESAILALISADQKSNEAGIAVMRKNELTGLCSYLSQFATFTFKKLIFSYRDREGDDIEAWAGTVEGYKTPFYILTLKNNGPHPITGENI